MSSGGHNLPGSDNSHLAEAVTFAVGEKWTWGGDCEVPPPNSSYVVTFAREFRYDGARQRYLVRKLNPNSTYTPVADVYTDYDGDEAYGDWRVEAFQPPSGAPIYYGETIRSFEPGLGTFEWEANPEYDPTCDPSDVTQTCAPPGLVDASTVKFYHGDHLGTTRFMTDATGAAVESAVYSAFGMRVSGTNHRYGYDGAWGYQSHSFDEVPFGMNPDTAFPFLHVGHRYYDPSTGRFLQRDPIGINGGYQVYAYVFNKPTVLLDPTGLYSWTDFGEDLIDIGGMIVGLGCAAAFGAGGVAAPGANMILGGGMVIGLGSAVNFGNRHPNPFPSAPDPPPNNRPIPRPRPGTGNCCLHGDQCHGGCRSR